LGGQKIGKTVLQAAERIKQGGRKKEARKQAETRRRRRMKL